ncbi:AsmA family protein [Halomonas cupida]|uniref:AsmA family protein n=1 Tax=Halomonas cupida TaxID=44933 RepID=UPI0039B57E2A
MKRLVRTLLAVIGVLALVMVGAVVYVTTFFNPEDLKPRLVEVVKEHTGLELALDGDLSWSFYPRIGVSVAEAEAWLPQQPDGSVPFASFGHASVSLAFAPLLKGQIAIDGLTLDGLSLNLVRNEQGEGNWEALIERLEGKGTDAEKALAPASAGPNPDDGGGLSVALNIANVTVENGTLRLLDHQAGQEWLAESLAVSGSNVNPTTAFPLSATFSLKRFDQLEGDRITALQSDVKFNSEIQLGLADERHVLNKLVLETNTLVAGSNERQQATLNSDQMVLDLGQQRLHMAPSTLGVSLIDPRLGDERLPLSLDFELESDLAGGTAQLRDIALTGPHSLSLKGNLNFRELTTAPKYSGQLRLDPMSLHPWLERLGALPTMADENSLSEVSLTTPVKGDLEQASFEGLTLVLDDSTFTGNAGARFDGSRVNLDLEGDMLDLDQYLPPADAENNTASLPGIAAAVAQEEAPALLPASWLAQLEETVALSLSQLTIGGQNFQDVSLGMQGENGKHQLTGFDAGFHEGRLQATGQLNASTSPLEWQLAPKVQDVRLDSLLVSLGEDPAPMAGALQAEGQLTSQGNSREALLNNLNGTIDAEVKDGSLPGNNISEQLCSVVARFEEEEMSRDWAEDTRFEEVSGTFEIRDGVAHNEDLLITVPGIEMTGEGHLELMTRAFEATGAARFLDTADAACKVNPRLQRVAFPARCEGTLGSDSSEWCSFDLRAFSRSLGELAQDEARDELREELDERVDEELENLGDHIGEDAGRELRDAVRGLFN